jgi:hypothetical protein
MLTHVAATGCGSLQLLDRGCSSHLGVLRGTAHTVAVAFHRSKYTRESNTVSKTQASVFR